jgi:hypothetical protein
MIQVQYISCDNDAGFVMNFSIHYLDSNGNWQAADWNSGNYPIDQQRTTPDLASIGVPADALAIGPNVHAVLGDTEMGTPYVQYAPNGQTATYQVRGTTLNFSVDLINGNAVEAKAEKTPAGAGA